MSSGDRSDFKELVRARTDIAQLDRRARDLAIADAADASWSDCAPSTTTTTRRCACMPTGSRTSAGPAAKGAIASPSCRRPRGSTSAMRSNCWRRGPASKFPSVVGRAETAEDRDGKPTRKEHFDVLAVGGERISYVPQNLVRGEGGPRVSCVAQFQRPRRSKSFRLGYAPIEGQFLQRRGRDRFNSAQLAAVRLICPACERDGYYDYFRGRVMFPIRDASARTVAFGGRVLPGAVARRTQIPQQRREPALRKEPAWSLLWTWRGRPSPSATRAW